MSGLPVSASPSVAGGVNDQRALAARRSPADAPATGGRREASIDVLRFVAIVLMIQIHFVENLSPRDDDTWWLYDFCVLAGVIPAPLFAFASGLSFSLWARKQRASGRSEVETTKCAVRRGLFLFAVGLLFSLFIWLPQDLFDWDILTLLGTSLLLLAYARHLPLSALGLICVVVLLLSPPLRVVGAHAEYWENVAYSYDFTLRDILFGFFVNGYFPVFPWILFPLAGFITSEMFERAAMEARVRALPGATRRQPTTTAKLAANLALVGTALMLIALAAYLLRPHVPRTLAKYYVDGFTQFPAATTVYVVGLLGLCLVSLDLLRRWLDPWAEKHHSGWLLTLIRRFSACSLTIYIVHHIVHLWPLWIYSLVMGHKDPTFYWREALSTPVAFGLFLLFVALYSVWLMQPGKTQSRYTLEALMRRV